MALPQPVSLDETPLPQAALDYEAYTPVSNDVAEDRATKAAYGVGTAVGKQQPEIADFIKNGQEQNFRNMAAAKVDEIQTQKRNQVIQQAAQFATPAQMADLGTWGVTPQDPDSVIEDAYAHSFMNNQPGSDLGGFREYVNTQYQNAEAARKHQGWVPYLAEGALGIVPFAYEAQLRLQAQNLSTAFSGGLGSTLEAMGDNVYDQLATGDVIGAKANFKKIYDALSYDPGLQSTWAHSVLGMSRDEKVLNNAFTVLDLSTIGGLKGVAGTISRAAEYNQRRRAVKVLYETMARATEEGIPPKEAKAIGTGENVEAAVQKTAQDLTDTAQGKADTNKILVDDLLPVNRLNYEALEAGGAGRGGGDNLNRVKNLIALNDKAVQKTIDSAMRVDQTPMLETSEKIAREIAESGRNKFKGPSNMVNQIDIVSDQRTNTKWWELTLTDENGESFEGSLTPKNKMQKIGYPVETTVREEVNQKIAQELTEQEYELDRLHKEKKEFDVMHADTEGLEYYNNIDRRIAEAEKRRDDAQALQGEYAIGPDTHIPGAKIVPVGLDKYVVKLRIPLDTTDPTLRGKLIDLETAYSGAASRGKRQGSLLPGLRLEDIDPEIAKLIQDDPNQDQMWSNIANTMIYLRTPGETLSPQEVKARIIATHGPGSFLRIAMENSRIISKIPKKFRKEFNQVLEYNRTLMDEQNLPGKFFDTIPELEEHYLTNFKRMPSRQEVSGYWAHQMNWNMDYTMRNLLDIRNRAMSGVEEHQLMFRGKDNKMFPSSYFDATTINHVPGGRDLVAYVDSPDHIHVDYADSTVNRGKMKKYTAQMEKGEREMIRIYDVNSRPLAGYLNDDRAIRYISVPTGSVNRRQINMNGRLGRRGGGHWDFDYKYAIKQAKIMAEKTGQRFRHRYEGDSFLAWVENHAMGQDFVNHLNKVRELIGAKRLNDAKQYAKAHLDINWKELESHFRPQKDKNGVLQPARFSTEEPFEVVPKDKKISDLNNDLQNRYPDTWFDATREGSDASIRQIQYAGERDARDLFAVGRTGDWRNPIFNLEPAKFMNPTVTMDRGLSRIMNSFYMEDYKTAAIEHWLQNAKRYIDLKPGELESRGAYQIFNNYEGIKSLKKETPDQIARAIDVNHTKINQFVGEQSLVNQRIERTVNKIADSIYNKTGYIVPSSLLPRLTDPTVFMRSATFDLKFLFSIPTFFTQLSTFANVAMINHPRYILPTTAGTFGHILGRVNERMVPHIGKMMENFGWRPGEWEEAREAMLNWTNFSHVGAEHAMLDSLVANHTITNKVQWARYWGRKFFEEGAQATRVGSFMSAYKQFRFENPTKLIGRSDKEDIMARAADLDHNMSRAFNSSLHTGWASFFGQFRAYTMRLVELMSGKRLTPAEKFRLFAGNAILWGIPASTGLSGLPIGALIREEAIKAGYEAGDNKMATLLMEGLPSFAWGQAMGTYWDFSKYGPDPILRALEQDQTLWEVMGGATWDTWSGIGESIVSPLWHYGSDMLAGRWKPTWQELVRPLRESTAVNRTIQHAYALSTGHLVSKNGTYMTDVDKAQSWFMFMTGMQPVSLGDASLKLSIHHSDQTMGEWAIKEYVKEWNRLNDAVTNQDQEAIHVHTMNAQTLLDKIPIDMQAQAHTQAMRSIMPLVDRAKWDLLRNVPRGQEQQRLNITR